ncbi:MmgE/PrpD family protein [Gordonia sp. TBRC 11910]|uniref:MmgE/PrpD family protein n=1 Tax=Gordonia asplenii TaxID=2725283 RepID=A0A848KW60_9ACTN|nr:MmgE/PrpD family protein [Gordonia asplenii]NMO03084.1 MmgE/PrpD family protein [Gordonia asplenii]
MTSTVDTTEGLTERLARHIVRVAETPPSPHDTEVVRRLLLDNFIVSLWGMTRPAATEIADWTKRFAGSGSSPVLGRDWLVDPSIAALVHGTAAHSFELDDTHNSTASHPGAAIIPAALAVAAEPGRPLTRDEWIAAIIAGYEAMALVGEAAGGMAAVHRGFHPTSLFGAFGAAVTALTIRALRAGVALDPALVVKTWGLALSQPSGSMQFSVEPTGGEVKRVHAGLGSHNGVRAADFAALPAVTAPRLALEGTYGVAASFGAAPRDALSDKHLQDRQIYGLSLKPYACCRLFHSTIDALAIATDGFTVGTADLIDILVTGPTLIAEQHMTPAESSMTAQYSCPYVVSSTLAYGPTAYDSYTEEYLDDPTILSIASRVRFEVDAELERTHYPEHFATAVRLTYADGTVRAAEVVDSVGTAQNPMSVNDIRAKADGLARHGLTGVAARLTSILWDDAAQQAELSTALQRESLTLLGPSSHPG